MRDSPTWFDELGKDFEERWKKIWNDELGEEKERILKILWIERRR